MLRGSLDEVIDMPRTNRFSLDELEKTEKTYIGTKVEILFRDTFGLDKGDKLDLKVRGHEVDVKNTIGSNWTIPSEALDEICVLLQANDNKSSFCFGLLICRNRVLNQGKNRDGKRTISKEGKNEILWIVKDGALPKNFFLHMNDDLRHEILSPSGGATRLANLFRSFQGEIITRRLVECVARQKDYMKRIRGNGGARDILAQEELLILWGGSIEDNKKLKSLGFKGINAEHFVCIKNNI
ncbi:NaeI family type II restriction endonuclease [Pseudobowmanella zhangzhouensis]|uniref:NaeI family type II restriction endonuclease n=1 Tax=Pseudobowmanella zhangzhouensis TaxID=1537679 RepID=UPI00360C5067